MTKGEKVIVRCWIEGDGDIFFYHKPEYVYKLVREYIKELEKKLED